MAYSCTVINQKGPQSSKVHWIIGKLHAKNEDPKSKLKAAFFGEGWMDIVA